jgi:hypothetical protein
MAVDIRLPLEAKAAPPIDPFAGQKGAVDLQNALNYGRSLDLQAKQRQQEVDETRLTELEDAAIQAAFDEHTTGEGEDASVDVHKAMRQLRRVVRPKRWSEIMTAITEEESKDITRRTNDYKLLDEATKKARETFESIQDLPENEQQTAYSVWKTSIRDLKIPGLQFLPDELTPEAKRYVNGWGLDVEGRKKSLKSRLEKEAATAFNADPLFSPEQIEKAFSDPTLRRKMQASIAGSPTYRELPVAEKVMKILDDRDQDELERYKAETIAGRADRAGKRTDRKDLIKLERDLADDYTKNAEPSIKVARQALVIFDAIQRNNPLDVIAAIKGHALLTDPATGVRDAEATDAEKRLVGSYVNQIESEARKAVGKGMTPGSQQNLLNSVNGILDVQKKIWSRVRSKIDSQADGYARQFPGLGLDKARIFGTGDADARLFERGALAKVTPKGKTIIRNGRKFEKLNDDTDYSQKNWREVR